MTEDINIEYLKFVKERIKWYGKKSKEYMITYNTTRIAIILLGSVLPFLVAQDMKLEAGAIGVFVAAATGIEGFLRPGEKWQIFRTTQIALHNELHKYELGIIDFPTEERVLENPKYKTFYSNFLETTGKIMGDEGEKFWDLAISKTPKTRS